MGIKREESWIFTIIGTLPTHIYVQTPGKREFCLIDLI